MKNSICFKVIISLLCLIILQGCYTSVVLDKTTFMADTSYKIHKVVTIDGKAYVFDPYMANFANDKIIGISNEKFINVPVDDVDSVTVQKFDTGNTCCLVGSGLGIIAIVLFIQLKHDLENWPFLTK